MFGEIWWFFKQKKERKSVLDCNRIKLEEFNVSYIWFFYFDECLFNTDHEILLIKYEFVNMCLQRGWFRQKLCL